MVITCTSQYLAFNEGAVAGEVNEPMSKTGSPPKELPSRCNKR